VFISVSNLLVMFLIWTGPETRGVLFAGVDDRKEPHLQAEFH